MLQDDKDVVGAPCGEYKYCIGHMFPNDVQAGHDLALALINESRGKFPDKTVELIAVSGSRDSAAAIDRNNGLERAVSDTPNTQLHQIVFAGWDPQDAQVRTTALLKRYPQTSVLWAASDAMALSMASAAKALGRTPGKDIFIGGVDWSDAGLAAVQQGDLVASLGGHFMEGGWVMVLLHDFHHGLDFSSLLGSTIRSDMQIINKKMCLPTARILLARIGTPLTFGSFQ